MPSCSFFLLAAAEPTAKACEAEQTSGLFCTAHTQMALHTQSKVTVYTGASSRVPRSLSNCVELDRAKLQKRVQLYRSYSLALSIDVATSGNTLSSEVARHITRLPRT